MKIEGFSEKFLTMLLRRAVLSTLRSFILLLLHHLHLLRLLTHCLYTNHHSARSWQFQRVGAAVLHVGQRNFANQADQQQDLKKV